MRKENPCKDCVAPKRHLGCHDRCSERAEWLEQHHATQDMIKAAQQEKNAMYDYHQFARKRMRLDRK